MFWKVFRKYPQIIAIKNDLSYPELQDIFAIVVMEEDYDKATSGLQIEEQKKALEKTRNMKGRR